MRYNQQAHDNLDPAQRQALHRLLQDYSSDHLTLRELLDAIDALHRFGAAELMLDLESPAAG